jgi:hypothetical protein
MMGRIPVIATRARVHAGNEHKRTRIFDGVLGSANGYLAIFQGLA